MVKAWKETYEEYRSRLSPNKKTGLELVTYLTQKYSVTELNEDTLKQVVVDNIILNKGNATKLSEGKVPAPKVFLIENTGAGTHLYENQDQVFTGIKIIVGIDLETAYFIVEGSGLLWDELFAFRGLDEDDLHNFYLVAEYIACVQKFGMLDNVVVR